MDDFGVKYFSKDDVDHLLESLKNHCEISTYWEGHNYLVLTIDWNNKEGYVDILMPDYVEKYLGQLHHPKPKRP